jgi:hypothetical protein
MYKVIRFWVFIVIAGLFFVGSLAFAEGKSKGNGDSPQGWDKGEKKGWHSDVPPGSDKKGNSGKDKPKGKKTKKNKDDKSSDDSSSDDNSDDKKEKKDKKKKK